VNSSIRHTLSVALGKAKIGGLVLAAMVLVAGTAEAATGLGLTDGGGDPVATVVDGSDVVDDGTVDGGENGEPVDGGGDPGDGGVPVDDPCDPVDEPTSDEDPVVDDGTGGEECTPTDGATDGEGDGEPVDEGGEPTDEGDDACAAAVNHGQYVSSIAKSTPSGPGKGAIVSEAAHSDCGKGGADDEASDVSDDVTADSKVKLHKIKPDKVKQVPPGQAKQDESSTSPGNSGNAAGHGGSSHAGGNGKGHGKKK
jgi:hypothetical protein